MSPACILCALSRATVISSVTLSLLVVTELAASLSAVMANATIFRACTESAANLPAVTASATSFSVVTELAASLSAVIALALTFSAVTESTARCFAATVPDARMLFATRSNGVKRVPSQVSTSTTRSDKGTKTLGLLFGVPVQYV